MQFIEYSKCSTCKKAKNWLDNKNIKYLDRKIKEETPSYEELSDAFGISYPTLNDMPLESIIESIVYLRGEINDLASIILGAQKDDTKVLRIGSKIPGAVYEQYRIRCNVLKKIMSNKNIIFC